MIPMFLVLGLCGLLIAAIGIVGLWILTRV